MRKRSTHVERGTAVKTKQIHQDKVGEKLVSTVFIEGGTGDNAYRYFETAIVTVSKQGGYSIRDYDVIESGVKTREQADEIHASAIELAEKVQAYAER